MTRDERAAARKRCEAAPQGPWTAEGFSVFYGDDFTLLTAVEDGQGFEGNQALAALRFAAHARTDLPLALDEIDRLEQCLVTWEECAGGTAAHDAAQAAEIARLRAEVERLNDENGRLRVDAVAGGEP